MRGTPSGAARGVVRIDRLEVGGEFQSCVAGWRGGRAAFAGLPSAGLAGVADSRDYTGCRLQGWIPDRHARLVGAGGFCSSFQMDGLGFAIVTRASAEAAWWPGNHGDAPPAGRIAGLARCCIPVVHRTTACHRGHAGQVRLDRMTRGRFEVEPRPVVGLPQASSRAIRCAERLVARFF